jgi:hypothetical protein
MCVCVCIYIYIPVYKRFISCGLPTPCHIVAVTATVISTRGSSEPWVIYSHTYIHLWNLSSEISSKYIHTNVYTYIHLWNLVSESAHLHAYTHTCVRTYIHLWNLGLEVHTLSHAHAHAHASFISTTTKPLLSTHTHVHTCIHMWNLSSELSQLRMAYAYTYMLCKASV